MADIPTWLGGVGQAIEALVVLGGAVFAAQRVDRFLEQREIGDDQARATAAAEVWDTVVRANDIVETLFTQPIKPATHPYLEQLCEARLALIRPALEGVNRSLGRAVLLLGDADIEGELTIFSEMLFGVAKKIEALPSVTTTATHVVSDDQHRAANAAYSAVLRKLHGVARRKKILTTG